jgi:hypothetical protein
MPSTQRSRPAADALLGIHVLGAGFVFSFLVNDDQFIPRRVLFKVLAVAPQQERSKLDQNSS